MRYSFGNLITVGLLFGFWAASFGVYDPYGYNAFAFLLIGIVANWIIVGLSLIFSPRATEVQQAFTLTRRTCRLLVTTASWAALLAFAMFWVLLPIPLSTIVMSILLYWILFGAAFMLLIIPFVLPVANLVNRPLEMRLHTAITREHIE